MAAGRSAKAGTRGGGADVRRRWGKEVMSAGAATTGGEGGDVGAMAAAWASDGRARAEAGRERDGNRGWEGRG